MPLLIIQLAVLVAVAFVIGCVAGRLLRRRKAPLAGPEQIVIAAAHALPPADEKPEPVRPAALPEAEDDSKAKPAPKKVPDAEVVGGPLPAAEPVEEAPSEDADRPAGLDGPREGGADDLTAIAGIGKAVEGMLNRLGIYHCDQIAQWSPEQSAWVERAIGFPRRVRREDWIAQAERLVCTSARTTAPSRGTKTRKTASKPKARKKTDA